MDDAIYAGHGGIHHRRVSDIAHDGFSSRCIRNGALIEQAQRPGCIHQRRADDTADLPRRAGDQQAAPFWCW